MRRLRLLVLVFLAMSSSSYAEEKVVRVAIEPDKAGPDFAVQGEYVGRLSSGETVGVQVVALGEARFDGVVFFGGLPGDGADTSRETHVVHGETVDGVTTLTSEHGKGVIREGKLTVFDMAGEELGVLEKVERQSPTLGAAPLEGAIVLFDGSSAEGFKAARLLPNNTLPAGAISKSEFGDCRLHLEFRTPFMPTHRGQNRGNSGVYLQGRYEVQVLDSFGLPVKDNECGGLYGFHEPRLNVCFPPLSWQTYDIEFHAPKFDAEGKKTANARLTVALNGVTIHEGAEMPHESGLGQTESANHGPLMLQFHLCPVQFRNIWYVPLTDQ